MKHEPLHLCVKEEGYGGSKPLPASFYSSAAWASPVWGGENEGPERSSRLPQAILQARLMQSEGSLGCISFFPEHFLVSRITASALVPESRWKSRALALPVGGGGSRTRSPKCTGFAGAAGEGRREDVVNGGDVLLFQLAVFPRASQGQGGPGRGTRVPHSLGSLQKWL